MKTNNHLYSWVIAGLGLAAALESSKAQSIDYPAPGGFYAYAGIYNGGTQLAFTFQAGSSTINDIEVLYASSFGPSGTVTVNLYSDFLGGAQSLIASDGLSYISPSALTDMPLTGLSNISAASLTPGTQDTLVFDLDGGMLSVGSDGGLSSANYITTGGWSVIRSMYLLNTGSGYVWTAGDGAAVAINVGSSPTPVPEASGSVAGIGLAMAGLYQLRRRKMANAVES